MSSSSRSIEPDPLLAGLARPHAGRHPAATEAGRLVVVSDRLPLALTREGGGGWRTAAEGGGLVPLLAPLLRDRRSLWIGWPGVAGEAALALRQVLPGAIHRGGCSLRPVMLGQEEKQGCYGGFSGEVIWPLFHGLEGECRFDPAHWRAYLRVNRRSARARPSSSTSRFPARIPSRSSPGASGCSPACSPMTASASRPRATSRTSSPACAPWHPGSECCARRRAATARAARRRRA